MLIVEVFTAVQFAHLDGRAFKPDANIADRKASISISRYALYLDFFGARFFDPVPVED